MAPVRAPFWFLALVMLIWIGVLAQLGSRYFYLGFSAYALALVGYAARFERAALEPLVRSNLLRNVAIGALLGALMVVLTHVAYAGLAELLPALAAETEKMYRETDLRESWAARISLPLIILAEEVWWRGLTFSRLEPRCGRVFAGVAAVVTYAVCQVGSGSWVVGVLAVACGTAWTLERIFTRSLIAPLVTHLLWNVGVLLVWPVAGSS